MMTRFLPLLSQTQCAATERAGQLAGLEKVKLMREPEAAALAYGLDKVHGQAVPYNQSQIIPRLYSDRTRYSSLLQEAIIPRL